MPKALLRAFVLGCTVPLAAQAQPPSPKEFLGQEIGADHFLADYTQLARYWRALDAASERMQLEEIGTTAYGQTMLMAVLSAPENLARREELRQVARRLALARDPDEATARELAGKGRAVVWIDAGMHATEAVAAQNILELVWRLVSRDDAETRRILENVIVLVTPANPDGMEMVARGYMATKRVGGLPVLYQRWMGHDNNRDFYMGNGPETVAINRQLYRRWHPQVVYNHHQTSPRGTVIFTPPFRDPFHFHVDPLVQRGIELVAAHVNHRFAAEGKPGVISRSGAPYSTWWNGGLRTTAYFHNQIGILTEVFGSPNPGRIVQTPDRRLPTGDYPMPIASTEWHARQTIEYLQTANFAILDLAARYREEFLRNAWRMGRNAIERGSRDHWTATPALVDAARAARAAADAAAAGGGAATQAVDVYRDPARRDARGYVLPAGRGDPAVTARFVNALLQAGVTVHRASAEFEAGGRRYPKDSFVVLAAQAFRAHVMDMFEPQWHPKDVDARGEPIRPYDSAGWTLALQMGVAFDRILDGFEGPFVEIQDERLPVRHADPFAGEAPRIGLFEPYGGDMATGWTEYVLREHGVTPRLLSGARVEQGDLRRDFDVLLFAAGLPAARGGGRGAESRERGGAEGEERAGRTRGEGGTGGDAPAGEQPPREENLADAELDKLLSAMPAFVDVADARAKRVRVGVEQGVPALRAFVEQGGRLLVFGEQATRAVRHFALPVRAGTFVREADGRERPTRRSEFYVPGSLLRMRAGDGREVAVMFRNNPVFEVEQDAGERIEVLARYAADPASVLASGWILGPEHVAGRAAILRARLGEGSITLFGPDVIYRGQAYACFPFVFEAMGAGK
ncbi:MAG: peptidase [Planctomycetes bacterium]|nr:peptidase [Planctomycetota bacterium]